MGVPSSSPPPVGTINVGELLADAQTKTLWLGVPASIDAAESVLISDLVGLQADDDDTLAAANAFTTSGLAGKSPVGHHHAISDVDGLTAALAAASSALPSGCIVLWSGTIGSIPGGWALCNGSNGTPDLRDRFVLGAGGTTGSALATGGSANLSATTGLGGAITPSGIVGDTALTVAMLPGHTHTISDPGHTHGVSDPGHVHSINILNTGFTGISNGGSAIGNQSSNTNAAFTGISITARTTGITGTNTTGSGGTHNHPLTMSAIPNHTHSITATHMPPYIILGYIMKV